MIDKRLKTIEQIQEILRNLNTDTDAETITVKADLIRAKLNDLKGKISMGDQSQQKELKSKDKQYRGLYRKLVESEERNFKLEKKLKDFQQFHRRKSAYYDRKIGTLFYENEKYEKLLRKKLAAQERVKECKKVIFELEQKLKDYEKFLAASKGLTSQRTQEQLVQRVFSKLKNFIQTSQVMGNKQQVEKMREMIKKQTNDSEKQTETKSQGKDQEHAEEDQDDDKMSIIQDELYDSEEQGDNQKVQMEEYVEENEEKQEIVVEQQEITEMEFLGQEQQSWLDWILSLTSKK